MAEFNSIKMDLYKYVALLSHLKPIELGLIIKNMIIWDCSGTNPLNFSDLLGVEQILETALMIYCFVTNYHKLSSFKKQTFVVSQFL